MDKMVTILLGIGALLVLIAAAVLVLAIGRIVRKRKGWKDLPSKFLFFLLFAAMGSSLFYLGLFFHTFSRYTAEERVGWLYAKSYGEVIHISYHDIKQDSTYEFSVKGDQWMIEGKFLRWNLMLRFLGKGALYKVVRISGRWDEGVKEATFFSLENDPGIWKYILKNYKTIPFVDTAYGIGAFQYPAEDTFDIFINDTGFILRRR